MISLKSAVVLDSGKSVLLQFQNSNGTNADLTAFTTLPTLKINGGPDLTPHGVLWQNPSGTNGWKLNGSRSNRAFLSLPSTSRFSTLVDNATDTLFTMIGSWSLVQAQSYDVPVGYSGNYRRSSVATDTATWELYGLTAGLSYKVHATWWAGPDRTGAATYTIRDGSPQGPILGSATFDQKKSPAATEPFYGTNGAVWQLVGTVVPSGTRVFVTLSNTAGAGMLIADATRIEVVRVMTSVSAGDTVTLSAPAGFAASSGGSCQAYTNLPVTNLVGSSILPQFEMTPKKMGTGYNLGPVSYWENGWYYRNRIKSCTAGWNTGYGTITKDSGGNLTSVSNSATLLVTTTGAPTGTTGPYWNLPYTCDGTWTLNYTGPTGPMALGSLSIVPDPNSSSVKLSETIVDGRNVATYRVLAGPNQTCVSVNVVATAVPAHDIFLYEPDVKFYDPSTKRSDVSVKPDPLNPTNIWNDWILDRLSGSRILRAVGPLHVDVCSTREWADFNHGTEDYLIPNKSKQISATIESIRPVDLTSADADGAQKLFDQQAAIALTFASPHPFHEGDVIQISGMNTTWYPVAPITWGTGNLHLDSHYPAFVKDANTILIAPWKDSSISFPYGSHGIVTLTSTRTPGSETWKAYATKNNAMPPEHVVDLCNRVGADAWMTVPMMATDDCAYQYGLMCGTKLNTSRKCYFELANEVWNWSYDEKIYAICKARQLSALYASSEGAQGVNLGYNDNKYYAYRVGQTSTKFREGWIAAGRNPVDLKIVVGCGGDYLNVANAILAYCNAAGIHIDVLTVAEYMQNMPAAFNFGGYQDEVSSMISDLDKDQIIDLFKTTIVYGGYEKVFADLNDLLKSTTVHPPNGFAQFDANGRWVSGVQLMVYEYSPDVLVPNWNDQVKMTHRCILDPAMHACALALLQVKEENNVACTLKEELSSDRQWNGGNPWTDYVSVFTKAGRGDGSDGLFDNRTNPESPHVCSVMAHAMRFWNSLCENLG